MTRTHPKDSDQWFRVFGRFSSRVSPSDADFLRRFLTFYQIEFPDTLTPDASISPRDFFPHRPEGVHLEIGFGNGANLFAQALAAPQSGFIGCEPFVKGVCQLLRRTYAAELKNVRVFTQSARLLLEKLRPSVLDSITVLFPDPWPKRRHHKRRLMDTRTLDACARVLRLGGRMILASDAPDYISWVKEQMASCSGLMLERQEVLDQKGPQSEHQSWVVTKYQEKAREAQFKVFLLSFGKIPG